MKLHRPEFERTLRKEVRRAVREKPVLKRAARRGRKAKHYSVGLVLRACLSSLLGLVVWNVAVGNHHPDAPLALIGLWALAGVFFQAHNLQVGLYQASDLSALELLPVATDTVFQWQFQKFLRSSLWLLWDLVLGFGSLAFTKGSGWSWLAVLPFAGLMWWLTLSLAALLVLRCMLFPYGVVTLLLQGAGFIVVVGREYVGSFLLAVLDRSAGWIIAVLPTAWPAIGFKVVHGEAAWFYLGSLVPTILLALTMRSSIAALRRDYILVETVQTEAPGLVPGDELEAPSFPEGQHIAPRRVGTTEIEDIVCERLFGPKPTWKRRGWLEEWLWRWLNERERRLSEFVWPDGPTISIPWKKAFRNLAIGMAAAFALGAASPGLRGWVFGLTVFISGCQTLVVMLNNGAAFRPALLSGVNIPTHAGLPVGYRELARLLLKYSAVQVPALLGFLMICGSLAAWFLGDPWFLGCHFGAKLGLLLLGLRLAVIVFAFSSGTNDSSRFRLSALALIVLVVALVVAALGCGIAGLFVPVAGAAWLLVLLAIFLCYSLVVLYGWFYNANSFDLMNLPRAN